VTLRQVIVGVGVCALACGAVIRGYSVALLASPSFAVLGAVALTFPQRVRVCSVATALLVAGIIIMGPPFDIDACTGFDNPVLLCWALLMNTVVLLVALLPPQRP
jgi:hypothetical protein